MALPKISLPLLVFALLCQLGLAQTVETPKKPAAVAFGDSAGATVTTVPVEQEAPIRPLAKARINVYRYKQYVGSGIRPSIYCDEHDVARVQNGRYVVLALTPGEHTLRSNDKQSEIVLTVKPDQEYYIRIDIVAGMWKGHGRLTLVLPEQGVGELKQMKPADDDMLKERELVAGDFIPTK
jgi:hypothetical protein